MGQSADYISAELSNAGYAVQRQEYEVDDAICANLEVEIPGAAKADEIVIIGAHYDSVPNCRIPVKVRNKYYRIWEGVIPYC